MKTYIWNTSIRISHWLLAIGFTIAYISGENHLNENMHYAMGALAATIAFMRILYGFFGSKYARFSDFPLSFSEMKKFIQSLQEPKSRFAGHNPMASYVMIGIFLTAVITGASGYFLYQSEMGGAYNEDLWEEVHELFSHMFLFLVIAHLLGLAVDFFFHKSDGTLKSIFTGYKQIQAESSHQNAFQKWFALLWFIVPFLASYTAYQFAPKEGNENKIENESKKGESKKNKSDDDDDDDDD